VIKKNLILQAMLKYIKFFTITFFIFLYLPLFAVQPLVLETDAVIVVYDEALENAAEQVKTLYPDIKQDLEKTFRWSLDFRPTVVLVKDSQHFFQIAGTRHIVAFAAPRENVMVIDHSRMHTTPFTLESTLKHELCHLLLHHYIDSARLPKWLDEGVSQWASNGIAEVIMDYKRAILPQAIVSGRYFRMNALHERFPRDKQALQLAYAQSKSFVDYISKEYGRDQVLVLLNKLREGLDIEAAIEDTLAINFGELEKSWLEQLKNKKIWLAFLTTHIYEIIFFLGAVTLIIGFIRFVIKRKAYKDSYEEDE
jgi:hypothetical protein